jgi:hypothetical protein
MHLAQRLVGRRTLSRRFPINTGKLHLLLIALFLGLPCLAALGQPSPTALPSLSEVGPSTQAAVRSFQLPFGSAADRIIQRIDENARVTLKDNVRRDIATAPDLGPVEDEKPLHLYLLLARTAAQQADLDNLIMRQQQPTAPEYHKWLTPKEFGARFGASPGDIATLSTWLESHGFQIRSILNNASIIDFAATAGQVREAFRTELHYFNIRGGKYAANVQDPQIPSALSPVVAGIKGLSKIPPPTNHTKVHQTSYDEQAHRWSPVDPTAADLDSPAYNAGHGLYAVTPQDFYTIYNVNPAFSGGELAAKATVAVIEQSDIEYGTVNGTTGAATGGDVATFRTLFGVPGTLNMHVYHGFGTVTCNNPGIDPDGIGEDEEASLDAEWINATAPSANEIFMSCDQSPDNGIFSSMAALIDNNLSDAMSLSYGGSELAFTSSDYTSQDTLYAQAASQGQSIFISSGDSGSDVADQNTKGTATYGMNVSGFLSPMVTATGGTDFSDLYDSLEGGPAQSTYWSSTNSTYYGDALSYIPETAWNDSCASSIYAAYEGLTGAGLCGAIKARSVDGTVVGGSGGISTHYAVAAWQTGISGYSNSMHSIPDIAGFAANGFWGHYLIFCDSNPVDASSTGCTSTSNFGGAGGTSFVAPYMAGVAGLLVDFTGSRQGLLNPALYALAKAQFTGSGSATACYSNGQTSNAGVTTGLPAAACIFNDVTTSNNDVPCQAGSTSCFVNGGDTFGMLSLTGSSSLSVAYPSQPGFDQVAGIGTINVNNLLTKWNTAFTSTTRLQASPTSITSSESTELTATVTGGTPTGYVDTPPALTGTASFKAGTTSLGSCTLSAGTCMLSVPGTALLPGANSVTATFLDSETYPTSTSTSSTVTVTAALVPAITWATPAAITYPTALSATQLDASSTVAGTFAYSPALGTVLTAGTHMLSVIFTPTDTTDYTTATASVQLTVNQATPMINWATPASIPYPTALSETQLDASSTVAGTFAYSPAAGTVLTAGTHMLSVIFTPTDITDYTTAAASVQLTVNQGAALISPAPGSVLGTSQTFTWSTGTGVTQYELTLGTTIGAYDVYNSGHITATSVTATNLPGNGATLYAELWSYMNGAWQYTSYTFTEGVFAPTSFPAVLISPTPGSVLGTSQMFTWSTGTDVTLYDLALGTKPGSYNLYNSGHITGTSAAVTGLPSGGGTIYGQLWSYIGGVWQYTSYTFTEQ